MGSETNTFVRVAMAQMFVDGGEPERNIQRARDRIESAAELGADIVVLPECLDLGWTHPSAREMAEPVPGGRVDILCQAARNNGIHVVAGIVERAGNEIYNTAVFISPHDCIILKHRKINVLSMARDLYCIGDRLNVVETRWGRIGLNICADNFGASLALGHSLCRMGAVMILSPCSWAVEPGHDNDKNPYGVEWVENYRSMADLYGVHVVGVSNVGTVNAGPWKGRPCIGNSIAVGPGGFVHMMEYGVDADSVDVIGFMTEKPLALGTDIGFMLEKKGYRGI